VEAPKDPDKNNIFGIYRLFASPEKTAAMAERFRAGGYGYGDAKKELFAGLWEFFAPFREKRAAIAADPGIVDAIRRKGAAKARAAGMKTLERVRELVGVR
jgi:tryptophanyl-tRNA synthetase